MQRSQRFRCARGSSHREVLGIGYCVLGIVYWVLCIGYWAPKVLRLPQSASTILVQPRLFADIKRSAEGFLRENDDACAIDGAVKYRVVIGQQR